MPRSFFFFIFVLVALVLVASNADAREHAVLAFSRAGDATDCPTEEELRRAVVARLGYDPFEEAPLDAPILRVHFARRAANNGFSARIGRGGGTEGAAREVTASRCADLLAPTAIALSIAVDPLASPPQAAPTPPTTTLEPLPPAATAPASSTVTTKEEPAKPPATAVHDPSARTRFLLDLSPHLAFGSAPAPAAGVTLGLGARFGPAFSLVGEGRVDLPASTPGPAGGEVSAQLLAASLVPCFHRSVVAACALGTLGSVVGEGRGVTAPSRDSSLYAAIGGRLGVEIPVREWLYFALRGDLVAALSPTILRLNGVDAWTSPTLNAVVGLGLGAMF